MNPSSKASFPGQNKSNANIISSLQMTSVNNSALNNIMGQTVNETVYDSKNQAFNRQSNQLNLPQSIAQSKSFNPQQQNSQMVSTNNQRQSKMPSTVPNASTQKNNLLQNQSNMQNRTKLFGNNTVQSIHVSKEQSQMGYAGSNKLELPPTINSVMKNASNNQSMNNTAANLQSQKMSTKQSNINQNASKNSSLGSFPKPPSNSGIQNQSQLSNNQLENQITGSFYSESQNPNINNNTSMNPAQSVQKSHISSNPNQISQNPHMSNVPNQNKNQSFHPKSQFISPNPNMAQSNYPNPLNSAINFQVKQQSIRNTQQLNKTQGQSQIKNPSITPQMQSQMNNPSIKPSITPQMQSQMKNPSIKPSVNPSVQSQMKNPSIKPSMVPQMQSQMKNPSIKPPIQSQFLQATNMSQNQILAQQTLIQDTQILNSQMGKSSIKNSLKASRNKSPPMVVKSQSGQIISTKSDCNGNKYSSEQKDNNPSEDKVKVEEEFKKSILIGKSQKEKPQNNKVGNGFRFYGQVSKAGKNQNGKTKVNQDLPFIHLNVGDIRGFNIFGVLDGHGPHGNYVSDFCRNYFMKITTEFANRCKAENNSTPEGIYNKLKSTNFAIIKEWYKNADVEMTKQNKFEYNFSGTTCNLVFQFNKFLVCASVGDSRGILIYDNGNKQNQCIYPLSNDHKPDLPQELSRILQNGGLVDKLTDEYGNKVGPYRVFKAGLTYPGIAMSRSLGDFQAKDCGVITEPEIIEYKINHHSKYMVICSDGVWEFLENEKVRDLGNVYLEKNDLGGFCTNLMNVAMKSWEKLDTIRDDITIVCVYF